MMLIAMIVLAIGCRQQTEVDSNQAAETKGDNQTNTETKNKETEQEAQTDNREAKVLENEAFKIITPVPNQKINGPFILKGKARVFEANFQYKLEDDHHNVLAEGYITADKGAPEWGDFEVDISYKETTSPNAILTIFEASAKDGSPQHELFIPLKIEND